MDVTATLSGGESTTMAVLVIKQVAVSGLTVSNVDSSGSMWAMVDSTVGFQAQVAEGSDLTAEWLVGDNELVYQVSLASR